MILLKLLFYKMFMYIDFSNKRSVFLNTFLGDKVQKKSISPTFDWFLSAFLNSCPSKNWYYPSSKIKKNQLKNTWYFYNNTKKLQIKIQRREKSDFYRFFSDSCVFYWLSCSCVKKTLVWYESLKKSKRNLRIHTLFSSFFVT